MENIIGLTTEEVSERKSLGLSNTTIDSYSPSYVQILIRNFFTVTTIALLPLLVGLFFFQVYKEVIVLFFFMITSAVMNTAEEVSVKKRLDQLKSQFKSTAKVIRDGTEQEIPSDQLVKDDVIIANEGDTILADGRVLYAEYLQVDESALTGESDYLQKQEHDEVLSGCFVVTGKCVYRAEHIGTENYFNRLGEKSTQYEERQSVLERNSARLIYIFTAVGILTAALNFIVARYNDHDTKLIVLGITTIIGNATPQSLVIIILLTFLLSVTKLARKGILIQKRGAIDELAGIDVICMDKTGTITTNEMKIASFKFSNLEKEDVKSIIEPAYAKLYGVNKTAKTVFNFFEIDHDKKISDIQNFDQIPFTSKQKYSAFQINNKSLILGAFSVLNGYLENSDITDWVVSQEDEGKRVMVGLIYEDNIINGLKDGSLKNKTNKFFALSIDEELNPGIIEVIQSIQNQGTNIKIISGDSLNSVTRIVEKLGIDISKSIDLSKFEGKLEDVVNDTIIFARAVPQDKFDIVTIIRESGQKVAMIGDGVNDVLGLKQADVGIAMESGAKVARDVSDIVLLGNDYKKIPEVLYEGDNIIFNLKLTAKIMLTRSVLYGIIALFFTIVFGSYIPINPTSTLISSFLGSTLVSYLLTLSRQHVNDQRHFLRDTLASSFPAGVLIGLFTCIIYVLNKDKFDYTGINTVLTISILIMSMAYAIFVLWDSGKLPKNIFIAGAAILVGTFIGSMQTILPLRLVIEDFDKAFLLTLIILGIIWLYLLFRYIALETNNKTTGKIGLILPPILLAVVFFFPARGYYAVDPIPFMNYVEIFIATGVFVVLIYLIHKLFVDKIALRR